MKLATTLLLTFSALSAAAPATPPRICFGGECCVLNGMDCQPCKKIGPPCAGAQHWAATNCPTNPQACGHDFGSACHQMFCPDGTLVREAPFGRT